VYPCSPIEVVGRFRRAYLAAVVLTGERRMRVVENCPQKIGAATSSIEFANAINRVCQSRLNSGLDKEIKCAGKKWGGGRMVA
jgi:hypothetical protein